MVRDVTGLYLNPPDKAVVLYVDEKSQVPGPGTDRYGAALPLVGHHDAVRRPGDRHRQGHRRLLPPAPARGVPPVPPPGREGLSPQAAARRHRHCGTHQYPDVKAWLAENLGSAAASPRPGTSSPRSRTSSTSGMTAASPFTWTKTPDELMPHCCPGKRTSFTPH